MHDVKFYAFVQIKQVESQSLAHVRTINELQEQLHGAQKYRGLPSS
jgi:hypothetical protein